MRFDNPEQPSCDHRCIVQTRRPSIGERFAAEPQHRDSKFGWAMVESVRLVVQMRIKDNRLDFWLCDTDDFAGSKVGR